VSSVAVQLAEAWAAARGFKLAWGRPSVVEEVRDEIARRRDEGELNRLFYDLALGSGFKYGPVQELDRFASVLMLAVPRTVHLLRFEMQDGLLDAVIPPTYVYYRAMARDFLKEISSVIGDRGRLALLSAPLKSVAARTGLVAYGRNNITYTKEFGSYQQLIGFATDMELEGAALEERPPSLMDECQKCSACRRACPTGAIGTDRLLLHAERCLTFLNEYPMPWPDFVPPSAHNAIEGCMKCQECCPVNRGKLEFEALPQVISIEETRTILAGDQERQGPVWDSVREKLALADLAGLDTVLSRNLRALMEAKKAAAG
jgi:epoxyqueuosine reductase